MAGARGALLGTLLVLGLLATPLPSAHGQAANPGLPGEEGPPLGIAGNYQGVRIREIRFRGVTGLDPERLHSLLAQKAGEPLDRFKIAQSIRALYATGRFADIEVEADRLSESEASLVFVVHQNYFVGPIHVSGQPKGTPTANQIINTLKLRLGEQFTEGKMKQGVAALQGLFREDGLYRAQITPAYTYHDDTQVIDILVQVVPGPRARVGTVTVEGDAGLTATQITDIAKLHPHDEVTSTRVRRALERVRNHYGKVDRLEAQVALVTPPFYHAESETVDYTFRIARGPEVQVEMEGAKVSKGVIKRYVPIYEEGAVDQDLLNEGRRNLRDYFQSQGYFHAEVEVSSETLDDGKRQSVVYTVDKGPRHTLKRLAIEGNHYFDYDTLRERMLLQPSSWYMLHGRFSQALLSRDVDAIQSLYQANGFQQVKVTPEVDDTYQGVAGHMAVTLRVSEGPQTRVASLDIQGNHAFTDDQLRQLLSSTEGQPFSQANLSGDHDAVVNFYFNHGFPDVRMEVEIQPLAGDPTRMQVTDKITEGKQIFVDRVLVGGLVHTRPYVVERELQLHPGDPLSQNAMLDTQRRLYDLGIFNQADVAVENPDGEEDRKNVMVQVEEARRYTFTYGFGFEVQTGSEPGKVQPQGGTGASPRVSLDVTRLNFRGRGHSIVFKGRLGELQQRALLSYEVPRWLNHEELKLSVAFLYDTTRDVRTFTAERLEGSVQAEQKLSRITTLLYRLSYRRVKVDPTTLAISPAEIPLLSKPVRIAIPSITYLRDTRDDPIESHKGAFTTFDAGVAANVLGSQASFTRFFFQNSSYYSFGKRHKYVLARSTRIGVEEPFSGTTAATMPLPERFYAGGGGTHRGFAINQAGPRDPDTGFPIGGDGLFLNNLELRLPPVTLPWVGDNVSLVFFHDMGNVFTSGADIFPGLTRWSQPLRDNCRLLTVSTTCNFNYNSNAIGGGIRYKTLIGPVRFDFGYNLNPPLFPVRDQSRSEVLTHFNFYFSIGQTF